MNTRPAPPTTRTKDRYAKTIASGSMQLPRLRSILAAARQTVPV
ncbi:MAG: hypothetical protein ACRDSZ_08625 [Pseudonocardiaceae bacterium]